MGVARRALLAGLALPMAARAQETWPARSITLVAPIAPGGPVDNAARPFAEAFGRVLGRPVARISATSFRRSSGVISYGSSSGRTAKHLCEELPTTTSAMRPITCLASQERVLHYKAFAERERNDASMFEK